MIAPIAVGALALVLFTGCAATPTSSASARSTGISAGLPIIDGKIVDEVKTPDKKGIRVTVSSSAADLLKAAEADLKAAGFSTYPTAKDAFGAKNEKYFVSVSVKSGKVSYLFIQR